MSEIKKMTMEHVQQLLEGSRRINQMKVEIGYFVSMIIGLLRKDDLSEYKFHETVISFEVNGFFWIVEKTKDSLSVCVVPPGAQRSGPGSTLFQEDIMFDRSSQIPMSNVLSIFQGLPVFLRMMIEKFPDLEKRMKPLFDEGEPDWDY